MLGRPDSFLQLLSRLQGKPSYVKKPVSFVSNSPTVSFAGSDAVRKKDNVVEIESAKKEEKAKSVTSSKSATRQPADSNLEESQEADKVPSKAMKQSANYRSTGAELEATKTPSNTFSKTPKAPGSNTSKTRSVSRPGSNLTPSKPSPEVPTNNMEAPSKNQAGADASKREAKSTMKTIDNSLEKSPKNLKPAVDTANADVKKKPAVASNQ